MNPFILIAQILTALAFMALALHFLVCLADYLKQSKTDRVRWKIDRKVKKMKKGGDPVILHYVRKKLEY